MAITKWTLAQILAQMDSGHSWQGLTITYAFPDSASGLRSDDGEAADFAPVDDATKTQLLLALQAWDDLIAPDFSEVTSNDDYQGADLEIGMSAKGANELFSQTYFPDAGSTWFNKSYDHGVNNLVGAMPGSYGFETYLHELGHALGLEHMGDYEDALIAPSSYQDSTVYSVMSYFGPNGPLFDDGVADAIWTIGSTEYDPQTPMLDDIYVIQQIYGASTTTRTGDTTYGFHSNVAGPMQVLYDFALNATPVLCLFDSSGNDTLDLSGWSTASTINLAPGSFSSANGMTNNISIAYSCTIENAVGGAASDHITGNAVANLLAGGGGADTIDGDEGDDTLAGGIGNDSIDGGAGNDTVLIDAPFASCTMIYLPAQSAWRVVNAATGTDTVSDVEFFQFSDMLRAAAELGSSDLTAPTLASATPADDASQVSPWHSLVLTFNENVKAGAGTVTLYNGNGTVAESFSTTDSSHVAFDGATVAIDPTSDLAFNAFYYVTVSDGAITDAAGNAYAGFAGSAAWNFTTGSPNLVEGTPSADTLPGFAGIDWITGFDGNDTLQGNGGDDKLDGGGGVDTAAFAGARANYGVTTGSGTITIADEVGADGTDNATAVERLRFADVGLAFDLDGNAGEVARLLGAVFGASAVHLPSYVGIGLLYADAGMSEEGLAQLALDARLGADASHAEIVELLYTNVVGSPPSASALATYTAMLDTEAQTPASLAVFAADSNLNVASIGLTGLVASGLEFV